MDHAAPPTPADDTWWRRAGGGREFLIIALPLVVSTLSWTINTFVDRMFLMWVSSEAMSAAFSAGAVWFALLCVPLGICAYANTFVAQYHGDHQPRRIGAAVWQAVWIAMVASPVALLAAPLAPALFGLADHDPQVTAHEIEYFQILCLGGPAMWICAALAAFYGGRGMTRVNMWIDAACAGLNVVLDWLWIFGAAGFPAMGVAGAAWATNAALWTKAIVYVVLVLRRHNRQRFDTLVGMRFDPALLRRLIRFGGPSGAQMLLEVLGFTVFIMLVGKLGEVEFAATSMAFSVSTLAFMPVWGVGMAASILVGQRLGENKPALAERSTSTALQVGLAYMGCVSACYLFLPQVFLDGFFAYSDADAGDSAEVYAMAVHLLRFVAAYNLFDAVLMVYVSALKGAGDTRYILNVSFAMAVLLGAISWFAVNVLQLGVYACWGIITAWIWAFGVIYWRRYRTGKWKTMRVIEQGAADGPADPLLVDVAEKGTLPTGS